MADSKMLEAAKDFAVEIVKLCGEISEASREYVLTKQLIRSGTSVGANIHESKYAQGSADFVSKMQIALKECYESEYWLELMERTGMIDAERYKKLNLAPYKGFINPVMKPVMDNDGNITDIQLDYTESYVHQMLRYGQEYGMM